MIEGKTTYGREGESVWVDENGDIWHQPTAWAYAQTCKALKKEKTEHKETKKKIITFLHGMKTIFMLADPRWKSEYQQQFDDLIKQWMDDL